MFNIMSSESGMLCRRALGTLCCICVLSGKHWCMQGPALRAQPATDPGKSGTSVRKRHKTHLMSPSSIPRTKAAAFF